MVAIGKGEKVLLSAYACEPGKGSEPGVGWNWALEIAKLGHEVWVLTRANNRENIEAGLAKMKPIPNLHFIYYDLPAWARRWKKLPGGIYPYCLFWQWGASRLAKEIHRRERFGLVHHITFGTFRQPSFMGRLGIPFLFGPVGGGERAPWHLRKDYGLRGQIQDLLRDFMNFVVKIDPLMFSTFHKAHLIFVKTPDTRELIPKQFQKKTRVQLEIGINVTPIKSNVLQNKKRGLSLLYVGRFVYWKGMAIGLRALAKAIETEPNLRLTMVGQGPGKKRWQRLCDKLGISDHIVWIPWVSHEELAGIYASHDLFLFPSLHDSSGNVVLEAMSYGLPVICLDLGGPGVMVNHECGRVIPVKGFSADEIIDRLAVSIGEIVQNLPLNKKLSLGAINRVKALTWNAAVSAVYRIGE
ncbi:MAG: glycosyltransferase family 4 protein [Proteobacteria bacterium]|nr:glycosyltransferase family 4 protein [Pseudomonadota bacterium]